MTRSGRSRGRCSPLAPMSSFITSGTGPRASAPRRAGSGRWRSRASRPAAALAARSSTAARRRPFGFACTGREACRRAGGVEPGKPRPPSCLRSFVGPILPEIDRSCSPHRPRRKGYGCTRTVVRARKTPQRTYLYGWSTKRKHAILARLECRVSYPPGESPTMPIFLDACSLRQARKSHSSFPLSIFS